MEQLKKIWTDEYRINWYDADAHNAASLTALTNFLQVSAFRHARHLGFDYAKKDGFDGFWVLVRILIKMDTYPVWLDDITIRTWHRGADGMVAMRDFEILDRTGKRFGAVSSHWFVLDPETRRAVIPEVTEEAIQTSHNVQVMEEKPDRIIIRDDLPLIYTTEVRYSDLDMYQHVNNTRYIDWILNSFPEDLHRDYLISSLMLEFLSEARYGEEVNIFASVNPVCSLVKGIRMDDGKTVFRAEVKWRKRG